MNEVTQVTASQRGDRQAFGQLIDGYYQRVYRLAYRFTGCHASADDVCQETFLQALEKLGSLRQPEQFAAWLMAIASNTARQHLKRLKRMRPMDVDDIKNMAEAKTERPEGSWDSLADQDKSRIVNQHIQEMPDHLRQTATITILEGLNQKQAARILGFSEASVCRYMLQARTWLQEKLRPYLM
jgi:RNA polymerase sigma-70 factor (ECF subfamily)